LIRSYEKSIEGNYRFLPDMFVDQQRFGGLKKFSTYSGKKRPISSAGTP